MLVVGRFVAGSTTASRAGQEQAARQLVDGAESEDKSVAWHRWSSFAEA